MCPLISPARGAPVSFIRFLMWECPVIHIVGRAPTAVSASATASEHFTS